MLGKLSRIPKIIFKVDYESSLVESDFTAIGEYIVKALKSADDKSALDRIKTDVLTLCERYPLYPDLQIL